MKIVGCDLHARQQTIAVVDTDTGDFTEKTVSHEGNAVREFYAALKGPVVVGIEATGAMQWFLELLEELGIECRVGHPAKIRAQETRKQKHDRRSAQHIALLMCADQFPDLRWTPTLQQRDQRQLLMHRHKLVRMRAQVKNQLQHIALNQGQQKKKGLWSQKGRELLQKLELEPWTARRRDDLLQLFDVLNGYCAGLDEAVQQAAAANAGDQSGVRAHGGRCQPV